MNTQNMEYSYNANCSVLKRNGTLINIALQMKLENFILSEKKPGLKDYIFKNSIDMK